MRTALTLFALALGAIAMSVAEAPADEKKSPSKLENQTEEVTIRQWNGKIFLNPVKIKIARNETKDGLYIYTHVRGENQIPKVGSEITDGDGIVWVVKKQGKLTSGYNAVIEKKN